MLRTLSYIIDGRVGDRRPESVEHAVKAIEDGVDVIAGQGTGMDAGPYYLGTDAVLHMKQRDIGPLIVAAKKTSTPFVFSMGGGAGCDAHLNAYLDGVAQIARDNGIKLKLAVVSGEVPKDFIKGKIRDGAQIRRSIDTERISEVLSEEDVDRATRVQAQMGPEPIMKAIQEPGIDGVITGRALDVGIQMATPLLHGVTRATAAHVGKVIECAAMCAEPTMPFEAVVADIDTDSFTVRPAHPDYRCTVRSVSGHSLYERENPFEERNPGGVLDVGQAVYEQVDDSTVRCSGGVWREVPYTVKLEGAQRIGYQAGHICAIRDEAMIASLDDILANLRETVAIAARGADVTVATHVLGRNAVLGPSEPMLGRATPYEVGVLVTVTAPTQDLANQLATTARLRLFMCDFPGRRSTAGNTAVPLQQTSFPLGEAYVFSVWHLMPLEDPCEPFARRVIEVG